jgi:hypothetical protein
MPISRCSSSATGNGLLAQTRRHGLIAALFGIREGHCGQQDGYRGLERGGLRAKRPNMAFATNQGIACIPVCAVHGDNVTRLSRYMPWYCGPTLIERSRPCLPHAGAMGRDLR